MSEDELGTLALLAAFFLVGFLVGRGRGFIAGVKWCTKRLDEDPEVIARKSF